MRDWIGEILILVSRLKKTCLADLWWASSSYPLSWSAAFCAGGTLGRQFKADQDLLVPLVTDLKVECAPDTFPRIFPVNRNLWGELKSLLLSNAVASHWLHSREWQSLSSFQPAHLAPLAQSFTPVFSAVNDIHQERKRQGFLLLKYKSVHSIHWPECQWPAEQP